MNTTIKLCSGRLFDFANLDNNVYDIVDIANGLAREGRYQNQLNWPIEFKVAQHSVMVAQRCPNGLWLSGLLHDAAEAYIGDMNSPLKNMPGMETYRALEKSILLRVCTTFGCPMPGDEVKVADESAYETEYAQFYRRQSSGIEVWTPLRARNEFMDAFKKYSVGR